jgi:squalene synthase HpnC
MRPHIAAVYAFARRADDFADEPGLDDAERLRLLDAWERRLGGDLSIPVPEHLGAEHIFRALASTIRSCRLPLPLLTDLLSAFRQDVTTTRYSTWTDLLDYCRRSANPVGRLVLRIAGYDDATLDAQSDAFCTALQLTNFWQDLAIDWRRGRLYVPLEDRDRGRARDLDLDAGLISPEWQATLATVTARTRALFDAGRPVCDGVRGRLRWELRLTWLGGSSILDRLEDARFDMFRHRPALRSADAIPLLWRALVWSPGATRPATSRARTGRTP